MAATAQKSHPLEGDLLANDDGLILGKLGDYRIKGFTLVPETNELVAFAIYQDGVANLVASFSYKIAGKNLKLTTVFSAIEDTPKIGTKFTLKYTLNEDRVTLEYLGKTVAYKAMPVME